MKVAVVGTGLIGGSLGLALRRAGLRVRGYDADADRLARAVARGAIDAAAPSLLEAFAGADVAFVAVPVSGVAGAVGAALDAGVGAVSDVSPGSDLFLNVRVKPAADLNRLEEVLVITEMAAAGESAGATSQRAADIMAERLPGLTPKPPPQTAPKTSPPAKPAVGGRAC